MNDKLEKMKIGGQKLVKILRILEEIACPGTNILQIERKAWDLIEKTGGYPSFAQVPGYSHATCLNINNGVVHGLPFDYSLKEGDLLNIDVGFFYKGFHTDCAVSFLVTDNHSSYPEKNTFLKTGEKTLKETIKEAVVGKRVGHISQKIEELISSAGYYPVKKYTGHGIGKSLHEKPSIPCLLTSEVEKTKPLSYNMTIAIEVIYTNKKSATKVASDGWSVKAADNAWAACFEKTVVVGEKEPLVLTPW